MALSREIEVLELKGRIESRAEKEMTDAQRQYVLRQQMKAIQSELGEGDSEVQEIRTRVTDAHLPERVEAAALREVDRLERMTPASPEYQMLRTYIDWVLDIPWDKPTEDRLDPIEARRVLDEDHYDLDKVKERIVEYLAVQKLRQRRQEAEPVAARRRHGTPRDGRPQAARARMKGPILCFVGPPGVGKTSLGQSIARAMNRKFVRISLGGVRDEAEIRGHRRTYIGSMPGRLAQALKTAGSSNPVLMLDEIDKISVGIQGDPAAALLEVLDPAQNHSFRDHYLEIPIDLSRVLFIATANQLGTIHPALLDRMEMISLSGYTEDEKVNIARKYLVPRQREENGLTAEQIEITDAALRQSHQRIHARGWRADARAADWRHRAQGGRARGRRSGAHGARRCGPGATTTSARRRSGPRRRSGRHARESRPDWRGPRPAATCSTSRPRSCLAARVR